MLGVAVVASVARRAGLPAPVLLVVAGLGFGLLPGVPRYELRPALVLTVFLPPLVYEAAINASLREFRANLRAIGLLSVGLVVVTALAVGLVMPLVVPGMPRAVAFALGAVVAPTDAVAATSIARRLGMQRRLVTVLEGESLVNDATALVLLRLAITASLTGAVSPLTAVGRFVLVSGIGLVTGLAVAQVLTWLRRRVLDEPLVENTMSLLTPFAAYLPAEALGGSGILAVVVAGLVLGQRAPTLLSSTTRLQAQAIWKMLVFLLEGSLFALVGLQLPFMLRNIPAGGVGRLLWQAAVLTVVLLVVRVLWVFPATFLPRRLSRRLRERDPAPPWSFPLLVSWAGLRGVVSLAAALALPMTGRGGGPYPFRDLAVLLTFCVVLTTLLGQGLSLPWLIRRLGLAQDEDIDLRERAAAQLAASRAALSRLEELAEGEDAPEDVVRQLRDRLEAQRHRARSALDDDAAGTADGADPRARAEAYRRLRRELLGVERAEVVRMRDSGEISEGVLLRMQRDLDLEENRLIGT